MTNTAPTLSSYGRQSGRYSQLNGDIELARK